MKKILLILLCILSPSIVVGQEFSVSVSPQSVKAWGIVEDAVGFSAVFAIPVAGNPIVGVHYFHSRDSKNDYILASSGRLVRKTSTLAASILPINLNYVRVGGMYTARSFPVSESPKFSFVVQAAIPISFFEVRYTHMSNGFGILHDINPGIDFISFAIKF